MDTLDRTTDRTIALFEWGTDLAVYKCNACGRQGHRQINNLLTPCYLVEQCDNENCGQRILALLSTTEKPKAETEKKETET